MNGHNSLREPTQTRLERLRTAARNAGRALLKMLEPQESEWDRLVRQDKQQAQQDFKETDRSYEKLVASQASREQIAMDFSTIVKPLAESRRHNPRITSMAGTSEINRAVFRIERAVNADINPGVRIDRSASVVTRYQEVLIDSGPLVERTTFYNSTGGEIRRLTSYGNMQTTGQTFSFNPNNSVKMMTAPEALTTQDMAFLQAQLSDVAWQPS